MIQVLTRYGIAGLINAGAGFAVIFACLMLGASGLVANVAGYAFGLTLSFVLNRSFVFQVRHKTSASHVARYLLVFAVAYSVNLLLLRIGQGWLGDTHPLAQIPGMAAYSLVFFSLSQRFVFTAREPA